MACQLFVTGFGPFQGIDRNPTSALLQLLEEYRQNSGKGFLEHAETKLLIVSGHAVRSFLEQDVYARLHRAVRPAVVVHLGVDGKADSLRLEWQAFNDATFRVPDVDGWQPKHEIIDASLHHHWGSRLITALPIASLVESLRRRGYPVRPSYDAGRFVCNWTYYISLQHCRHHAKPPTTAPSAQLPSLGSHSITQSRTNADTAPQSSKGQCGASSQAGCSMDSKEKAGMDGSLEAAAAAHSRNSFESWQVLSSPEGLPDVGDAVIPPNHEPSQGDTPLEGPSLLRGAAAGAALACSGESVGSDAPPDLGQDVCQAKQGGSGQSASQTESRAWEEQGGHGHAPLYALFVHVPPFTVIPERVQFQFLLDLLRELVLCVEEGREAQAEEVGGIAEGDGGRAADQQLEEAAGPLHGAASAGSQAGCRGAVHSSQSQFAQGTVDTMRPAALDGSEAANAHPWAASWHMSSLLSCKLQ